MSETISTISKSRKTSSEPDIELLIRPLANEDKNEFKYRKDITLKIFSMGELNAISSITMGKMVVFKKKYSVVYDPYVEAIISKYLDK